MISHRNIFFPFRVINEPPSLLLVLVLPLLALLLLLAACGSGEESREAGIVPEVESVEIRTERLQRTIEKGATVSYLEKAAVSSPIEGTLASIDVHEGDRVQEGQPMAQLETLDLELALKRARANEASAKAQWQLSRSQFSVAKKESERYLDSLESARSNLVEAKTQFINAKTNLENKKQIFLLGGVSEMDMKQVYSNYVGAMTRYYQAKKSVENRTIGYRKKDLQDGGYEVPTEKEQQKQALIDLNTETDARRLDASKSAYESAVVQRQAAEQMLERATIRAPLNGVVATRGKEPGEEVKPGEAFLTVVRTDELLVSTSLPESELPHVSLEQPAAVSFDIYPNIEFEGKVHRISPVIDPKTRSFQVSVLVKNDEEHPMAPGMFARLQIRTLGLKGMAIPADAILSPAEESREFKPGDTVEVFVIRQGHAYRRSITLGERFEDRFQVTEGLSEGDEVIISDPRLLKDSMMVRTAAPQQEDGNAYPANESSADRETDQ